LPSAIDGPLRALVIERRAAVPLPESRHVRCDAALMLQDGVCAGSFQWGDETMR
jgi:hypothetical protein